MSALMETISIRLGDKGLVPLEIDRLVKDVSNIIYDKQELPIVSLKQTLAILGWEEHILDNHTLWLILSFLK